MHEINTDALSKALNTIPTYRKIIEPLRLKWQASFIYAVALPNGYYDLRVDNEMLLSEFVCNIDYGYIFSKRNVTRTPNYGCEFIEWPDQSSTGSEAMYQKYNLWNGLTVLQCTDDGRTEMWAFVADNLNTRAQEFFAAYPQALMDFIQYFESHKEGLNIKCGFKLAKGFNPRIIKSIYAQDNQKAQSLMSYTVKHICIQATGGKKLSPKEVDVLALTAEGESSKSIAKARGKADRTVRNQLTNIKLKTGLRFKRDLIKFYHSKVNKRFAS